ncbi:hypothetical protein Y888_19950 [Mixta calida B021323]|uniref:hypothetical protein n=1 Tax=Mixta calida TaxID=665913 RepID=UPI0006917FF9|nr:hypothetical protein Y888_19950 [Mixta calida B021323]ORM51179.1 hypothetical protein HA40_19640 [Mixta calida]
MLTRQADATVDAQSRSQMVQLTLNGDVDWGRVNHQLLFGFDYEADRTFRGDMIRGAKDKSFNVYQPVYDQMPASTAGAGQSLGGGRKDRSAWPRHRHAGAV